jgi:pilus assembly protein CpaB
VSPDDLEPVEIPQRWVSDEAVRELGDLVGMVTAAPLSKGTLLQTSSLIPQPTLEAGQREIAILVDAETGVAGKVEPGDRVDVWATFDESVTGTGPRTKLIAQNLLVINVGVAVERERVNRSGGTTDGEAVPITFAAERGQIQALSFAESFAIETRLALRPPGDSTLVPGDERTYQETFGIDGSGR